MYINTVLDICFDALCVRPRVGSGVERIDPLHFPVGCHRRRLNEALSVLSLSIGFIVVFSAVY